MSLHSYDYHEIACAVRRHLKDDVAAITAGFNTVTAAQQQQLDRIEGKLDQLLALLQPHEVSKFPVVAKKTVQAHHDR